MPRRIVISHFAFAPDSSKIRVDREGAKLQKFKDDLAVRMDEKLVKDFQRFGLPVEMASRQSLKDHSPAWLVTGEFTRINQGSRALRVVVGMGAGGTKMETRVKVTEIPSGREVCAFRTTGGSNITSGIITSYGPVTVASAGTTLIGAIMTGGHGVTEDTARTAKMISDYVSLKLADRGAIPRDKARPPKILAGPIDPLQSLKN